MKSLSPPDKTLQSFCLKAPGNVRTDRKKVILACLQTGSAETSDAFICHNTSDEGGCEFVKISRDNLVSCDIRAAPRLLSCLLGWCSLKISPLIWPLFMKSISQA